MLDDDETLDPPPIERFRATALGAVFAAGLLGLRDALETPLADEPAIVRDWSGEPPFSDPIVLRLDPEHPEDSIVMVRPWLRDAGTRVSDGSGGDDLARDREPVELGRAYVDPEAGPIGDA